MFNPIKKVIGWNLNRKQAEVEKLMEEEGFTDEVLEKQVAINEARHKHDITDESKLVYDKYVQ
ncbi:hypothetical protein [uncultured Methanobrevibacter sp.]|uniref:hypothetical protein n=1 Tax=uncultured Methanobrevibacter sp. TaxID=253161 RepID=UPI0025E40842|nr:hypothetical protein [uncultured Methanobrevibacter sp.]